MIGVFRKRASTPLKWYQCLANFFCLHIYRPIDYRPNRERHLSYKSEPQKDKCLWIVSSSNKTRTIQSQEKRSKERRIVRPQLRSWSVQILPWRDWLTVLITRCQKVKNNRERGFSSRVDKQRKINHRQITCTTYIRTSLFSLFPHTVSSISSTLIVWLAAGGGKLSMISKATEQTRGGGPLTSGHEQGRALWPRGCAWTCATAACTRVPLRRAASTPFHGRPVRSSRRTATSCPSGSSRIRGWPSAILAEAPRPARRPSTAGWTRPPPAPTTSGAGTWGRSCRPFRIPTPGTQKWRFSST